VGGLCAEERTAIGGDRCRFILPATLAAGKMNRRRFSPEDCYAAVLLVRDDGLVLRWSIDGPRKQEVIEYVYSSRDIAV
jgi:hypothetical protein